MKLLVGTYSQDIAGVTGNGEGIYAVSFDPNTGAFESPTLAARCANPSSLAMDRENNRVFCGKEVFAGAGPALVSYQMMPNGSLTLISELPLEGELPCHMAFDPHFGRLASAQYWTGDAVLCDARGGELTPISTFTRDGTGPNANRQEGPHAHCVAFTDKGRVLHLADLGTDRIVSHRLSPDGQTAQTQSLPLPAGVGPRHIAINAAETRAYVVCELSEDLVVLDRDGIGWRCREVVPGFMCAGEVEGSAAAIRLSPDERHVYISGRRQSRIAAFLVTEGVTRLGDFCCGGECPREFVLSRDGRWLISANQDSGTLTALPRDTQTGLVGGIAGSCEVPSPIALLEV